MKISFVFLAFFLFSTDVKASSESTTTLDSTWTLDTTVNNVKFYYKIDQCNGNNTVFLAFDNQNSYDVDIEWEDIYTTQLETNTGGMEGAKTLTLEPGGSTVFGCSDDNICVTKSHEINIAYFAVISSYSFNVISVNQSI